MISRRTNWLLALLGATVVALILLAMALPRLELRSGTPFSLGHIDWGLQRNTGLAPVSGPSMLGPWRALMTFIVWVLVPVTILLFIIWPDIRRRVLRRLLLGIVWTTFFVLAIRGLQQQKQLRSNGVPSPPDPDQVAAALPPSVPDFILHPPAWFVTLVSLILATGIFFLIRWFTRRPIEEPEAPSLEEIADEARSALSALRSGGDLRDTVLRCYIEMSRILSSHRGVQRPVGMTPREFEYQLQRLGVSDAHVRQLTQLFERVRYGAQAADSSDEQEALACLTAIVQTYGTPT